MRGTGPDIPKKQKKVGSEDSHLKRTQQKLKEMPRNGVEERLRRLEAENRELRSLWSDTEDTCVHLKRDIETNPQKTKERFEEIEDRLHSVNRSLRRIVKAIDRLSGGKDVWKKGKGGRKKEK